MSTNKYRVHRFGLRMTAVQSNLEQFLNSLEGEIMAIIPKGTMNFSAFSQVHFHRGEITLTRET